MQIKHLLVTLTAGVWSVTLALEHVPRFVCYDILSLAWILSSPGRSCICGVKSVGP